MIKELTNKNGELIKETKGILEEEAIMKNYLKRKIWMEK